MIDRERSSLTASDRHRQPHCEPGMKVLPRHRQPHCEPGMKVLPSIESACCSLISSKSRNDNADMAATHTLSLFIRIFAKWSARDQECYLLKAFQDNMFPISYKVHSFRSHPKGNCILLFPSNNMNCTWLHSYLGFHPVFAILYVKWAERLHLSIDFSVAPSSSSLVQTGRHLQCHDIRRHVSKDVIC
jgi:hypothetical protein